MQVLISAAQIQERIGELAAEISRDYGHEPVTFLGILSGSFIFMADLLRKLALPTRIGFLHASSYRGETTTPGQLVIQAELIPEIRDRHVLLLDDILDSGRTLSAVADYLSSRQPKSLRVAVLLRKRGRQEVAFEPDYCGFEIPNQFVVGYGLDYNDDYRHLPYLGVLPGEEGVA